MDQYKFVDFTRCVSCEHFSKEEKEAPCVECLEQPVNLNTNKPVCYMEKGKKK